MKRASCPTLKQMYATYHSTSSSYPSSSLPQSKHRSVLPLKNEWLEATLQSSIFHQSCAGPSIEVVALVPVDTSQEKKKKVSREFFPQSRSRLLIELTMSSAQQYAGASPTTLPAQHYACRHRNRLLPCQSVPVIAMPCPRGVDQILENCM